MHRHFYNTEEIDFPEFVSFCEQNVDQKDYPFSSGVDKKIVHYEGDAIRSLIGTPQAFELKTELHHCLKDGPGVFAIKQAFQNLKAIDRATEIFRKIIAEEKNAAENHGDHFAKPGENERLWNSLQKMCERDAETFISYYDNPVLCLVCEAWLGPFFQMTAQVNIVKPGGKAQQPHRDYHLGFQENEVVSEFPVTAQILSQVLTLQGAVAHTEMKIESGPTMFLPFSQQYPLGYMAWRDTKFIKYFEKNSVQISMKKGDAVFLSPALFHAGGTNTEKTDRIANLLQISSAFGKAMESVDRVKMTKLIYPVLLEKKKRNQLREDEVRTIGASVTDSYSFPTNLDTDSPTEGSVPETAQSLMERALSEKWSVEQFCLKLDEAARRGLP
ncbi:MAG: phytanoyl-CoA dioxygenase family protein [Candidatus Marinimicrobia bacterium]|nr:phytanoyl-CoA dioxygenase family protein [Candidatus Neomarinimicrobiota bacterium]